MKHNPYAAILAVLLVVCLIGCGGAGGGGASSSAGSGGGPGGGSGGNPSPFQGQWSGSFEDAAIPVNGNGTVVLTVDSSGSFEAGGHNNVTHADLDGSGTISDAGHLVGTLHDDQGHMAHMDGTTFITSGPAIDGNITLSGDVDEVVKIHLVLQ